MEQRTYHGEISVEDLARAIVSEFDHGNMEARSTGHANGMAVQIATRNYSSSGGRTGVTVTLRKVEDGVLVQIGDQQILGVAASLGATALSALHNPLSLLGRLDDLAQDISSLQLSETVWACIQKTVNAVGASHQISERLRRLECGYCGAAAPVGAPTCPACGGPLGSIQPRSCLRCGFVPPAGVHLCPKCNSPVQ